MLNIFILSWNGAEKLQNLYPGLINNLKDIDYKIFIKDNGSVDNSKDIVSSWKDEKINFISYPNNLQTYSQGMNYLFDHSNCSESDLVLTLNNDIIFNDSSSLKNMINIIKNDKNVGLVGAKLNYVGTKKLQHCGVLFHPYNGLPFHYRSGKEEEVRDIEDRIFPIITGAVALTRASIYKKIRMNESFKWAFEDCDFSMRITNELRLKVVCCGKTNIFHEESATLKKNPVNKMFMNSNMINFLNLWKKNMDKSLVEKYSDPNYNLYRK